MYVHTIFIFVYSFHIYNTLVSTMPGHICVCSYFFDFLSPPWNPFSLNCGSTSFHVEKAAAPQRTKLQKKTGFFIKGTKIVGSNHCFSWQRVPSFKPWFLWRKTRRFVFRFFFFNKEICSCGNNPISPITGGLTNHHGEVNGCVKGRLEGTSISPPTRHKLL